MNDDLSKKINEEFRRKLAEKDKFAEEVLRKVEEQVQMIVLTTNTTITEFQEFMNKDSLIPSSIFKQLVKALTIKKACEIMIKGLLEEDGNGGLKELSKKIEELLESQMQGMLVLKEMPK